jgi:hypothetical protein
MFTALTAMHKALCSLEQHSKWIAHYVTVQHSSRRSGTLKRKQSPAGSRTSLTPSRRCAVLIADAH